jgi:hypothetical protein
MAQRLRVPTEVVHRSFPEETVVLHLGTGLYHGLNGTAARMLEVLDASPTVGQALEELRCEFDVPPAEIERDLVELCRGLIARGLVVVEEP